MKLMFLLVLLIPNLANAITVTGKVNNYRTFPEAQSVVTARNHVVFTLDTSFSAKCSLLYLSPNDTNSIALLLAAKMSKTTITVVFTEESSPWHEGTCKAVEVSFR